MDDWDREQMSDLCRVGIEIIVDALKNALISILLKILKQVPGKIKIITQNKKYYKSFMRNLLKFYFVSWFGGFNFYLHWYGTDVREQF